jgi:hypothetical protein
MTDSVISWEKWEKEYQPIKNPHSRDPGFWGSMFETFEPDTEYLKKIPNNYIWTLVDNNPNSVYLDVVPGVHWANRMGYFATEFPWEDSDMTVSNDPSYR